MTGREALFPEVILQVLSGKSSSFLAGGAPYVGWWLTRRLAQPGQGHVCRALGGEGQPPPAVSALLFRPFLNSTGPSLTSLVSGALCANQTHTPPASPSCNLLLPHKFRATYLEFGIQHAHFKVIFTAFGLRFAEFYEAHLDSHYEIIK